VACKLRHRCGCGGGVGRVGHSQHNVLDNVEDAEARRGVRVEVLADVEELFKVPRAPGADDLARAVGVCARRGLGPRVHVVRPCAEAARELGDDGGPGRAVIADPRELDPLEQLVRLEEGRHLDDGVAGLGGVVGLRQRVEGDDELVDVAPAQIGQHQVRQVLWEALEALEDWGERGPGAAYLQQRGSWLLVQLPACGYGGDGDCGWDGGRCSCAIWSHLGVPRSRGALGGG
jgi:hypothetical protein